MRNAPEKFQRGPKATRDKLNAMIDAINQNKITVGPGLRMRESKSGLLITLDEEILLKSGLANTENFGSTQGDSPFGGGGDSGGDEENQPADPEPNPEGPWDGSDGTGGGGGETGGGTDTDGRPPLMWATFVLPDADLEEAYSASLFAVGGTGTYSYAITGGALPPGLTLSGNTITGIPTSDGSYSVQITVTSGTQSKPSNFSLMVSASGGSVKITGAGFLGLTYWTEDLTATTTLSVVGGTPPYAVFFTVGSLSSWYAGTFNGPNVARPSSMSFFPTGSIYGEGITVTLNPRISKLVLSSFQTKGISVAQTPQGPRRMTLVAFDSTGASYSKTIVADFLWDTSKYGAAATGPGSIGGAPYPQWILLDSSGNLPSAYTPYTGTLPFVT
jgi:hypothetical protein